MTNKNNYKTYNLKNTPKIALHTAIISLFIGSAGVSVLSLIAPKLLHVMALTHYEVGVLVAIPALIGALARLPFSLYADKTGGKASIVIMLVLSLAGLMMLMGVMVENPTADISKKDYGLLLTCGALAGFGMGIPSSAATNVSYWFPKKTQGHVLGMLGGFGGTAPSIVTIILPVALILFDYGVVFTVWFLIAAVGALMFIFLSSDAYYFQLLRKGYDSQDAKKIAKRLGQEEFPTANPIGSLKDNAKELNIWLLSAMYRTSLGVLIGLTSWMPTFWMSSYGLSLLHAGLLTGGMIVFSPLMRIVGGTFADKFSGEFVTLISLILCAVSSLMLSLSSTVLTSAISAFILVVSIGSANGAIYGIVPRYSSGGIGGASGIVGGVGALGGFLIPPILGYIVEVIGKQHFNKSYLFFVLIFTVAIVMSLILMCRRSIQIKISHQ